MSIYFVHCMFKIPLLFIHYWEVSVNGGKHILYSHVERSYRYF